MPAFVAVSRARLLQLGACLLATVADGLLMLALFGIGWALFRDREWYAPPRALRYAGITAIGVSLVVAVDAFAVYWLRLWGYAAWQPTALGIGILVWLQPVSLAPLSFFVLARAGRRVSASGRPRPSPSPGGAADGARPR